MQLAAKDVAHEVVVAARNVLQGEAAVLDAGSAYPEVASKFVTSDHLEGVFDVIVVTAGTKDSSLSQEEMLRNNVDIVLVALEQATCEKLVLIGSPVDRVTEKVAKLPQFQDTQVIGFGGQLDVARTAYVLAKRSIQVPSPIYVIGEHGLRTIPVYESEEAHETIQKEVGGLLGQIKQGGESRNLATGVQVTRLLEALAGVESILCVSTADKGFEGLSITWPYVINESGLSRKVAIPAIRPKLALS